MTYFGSGPMGKRHKPKKWKAAAPRAQYERPVPTTQKSINFGKPVTDRHDSPIYCVEEVIERLECRKQRTRCTDTARTREIQFADPHGGSREGVSHRIQDRGKSSDVA